MSDDLKHAVVNYVEDRDIDTRDKTGGMPPEEAREYVVRANNGEFIVADINVLGMSPLNEANWS
ncbi:hypothetical protein H4S03_000022 [Coemansia sp. S3946]|nr:hypothetical protein H4S03_000022 [Coemansia sp. S3946]